MNDLISRQEAITELSSLFWPDPYDACNKNYGHDEHNCAIAEAIDEIEGLPSAQPKHKKGKWIAHLGGKFVGFPYMHYECDQCRAFEPTETNFCPDCGADMRGEQDE